MPASRSSSLSASIIAEISSPHRPADQIDDEPSGGDGGDTVHVAFGCDLDDIHAHYTALSDETVDQRPDLGIGNPSRCRAGNRRHDRRVHAVGIDGEVI